MSEAAAETRQLLQQLNGVASISGFDKVETDVRQLDRSLRLVPDSAREAGRVAGGAFDAFGNQLSTLDDEAARVARAQGQIGDAASEAGNRADRAYRGIGTAASEGAASARTSLGGLATATSSVVASAEEAALAETQIGSSAARSGAEARVALEGVAGAHAPMIAAAGEVRVAELGIGAAAVSAAELAQISALEAAEALSVIVGAAERAATAEALWGAAAERSGAQALAASKLAMGGGPVPTGPRRPSGGGAAAAEEGGLLSSAVGFTHTVRSIAFTVAGFEGIVRMTQGLRAAVTGASDLNETLNKTKFVFGESTPVVVHLAEEMRTRFGQSRTSILDAASSFGLIGKAASLAQPETADLSAKLARLAVDAQSFFNVPLPEVLDSFRSGLVGEAEPMRRFGVLLDENTVKQHAYAMGIARVGQELTQAQKVQSRFDLILNAPALQAAAGDMERTADQFANRMRIIGGRIREWAVDIGTAAIPHVLRLVDVLEQAGRSAGPTLASAFGAIGDALQRLQPFFSNLIEIGGNLWDILVDLGRAVAPFVTALGGLAAVGIISALNGISTALSGITGFLADNEELVRALAIAYGVTLIPRLVSAAQGLSSVALATLQLTAAQSASGATGFLSSIASLGPTAIRSGADITAAGGASALSLRAVSTAAATSTIGLTEAGTAGLVMGGKIDAGASSAALAIGRLRIGLLGIGLAAGAAIVVADHFFTKWRQEGDKKFTAKFGTDFAKTDDLDKLKQTREELRRERMRLEQELHEPPPNASLSQQLQREMERNRQGIPRVDQLGSSAHDQAVLRQELEKTTKSYTEVDNRIKAITETRRRESETVKQVAAQTGASQREVARVMSEGGLKGDDVKGALAAVTQLQTELDGLARSAGISGTALASMFGDNTKNAVDFLKAVTDVGDKVKGAFLSDFDVTTHVNADPKAIDDARKQVAGLAQEGKPIPLELRLSTQGPLEQLRQFYDQAISKGRKFGDDYNKAVALGFDPELLQRLVLQGPEKAGPMLAALVSQQGQGMVGLVNTAETELRRQSDIVRDIATKSMIDQTVVQTLTTQAVEDQSGKRTATLGNAIKVQRAMLLIGEGATYDQVKYVTGLKTGEIQAVVDAWGLKLFGGIDRVLGSFITGRTAPGQTPASGRDFVRLPSSAAGNVFLGDRTWNVAGDVRNAHQPEIVRGGAWRAFGEDETQGESYIPHAPDHRRPRAQGLLAQTARILGMVAMPVQEFRARLDRDTVRLADGAVVARHEWAGGPSLSPRPALDRLRERVVERFAGGGTRDSRSERDRSREVLQTVHALGGVVARASDRADRRIEALRPRVGQLPQSRGGESGVREHGLEPVVPPMVARAVAAPDQPHLSEPGLHLAHRLAEVGSAPSRADLVDRGLHPSLLPAAGPRPQAAAGPAFARGGIVHRLLTFAGGGGVAPREVSGVAAPAHFAAARADHASDARNFADRRPRDLKPHPHAAMLERQPGAVVVGTKPGAVAVPPLMGATRHAIGASHVAVSPQVSLPDWRRGVGGVAHRLLSFAFGGRVDPERQTRAGRIGRGGRVDPERDARAAVPQRVDRRDQAMLRLDLPVHRDRDHVAQTQVVGQVEQRRYLDGGHASTLRPGAAAGLGIRFLAAGGSRSSVFGRLRDRVVERFAPGATREAAAPRAHGDLGPAVDRLAARPEMVRGPVGATRPGRAEVAAGHAPSVARFLAAGDLLPEVPLRELTPYNVGPTGAGKRALDTTSIMRAVAVTNVNQRERDVQHLRDVLAMQAAAPAAGGAGGAGGRGGGAGMAPEVQLWINAGLNLAHKPASWLPTLLHLVSRESGGNPRAVNPIPVGARREHATGLFQMLGCVPLDSKVLTRTGWKAHDEVRAGDETLGFNAETETTEWTKIRRVVHYDDADVWRIGNGHWTARVTPDHKWLTEQTLNETIQRGLVCPSCRSSWKTQRGMETHLGKVHGKRLPKAPRKDRRLVATGDLNGHHRVRVAAPALTGDGIALTEDEVRIVAWVVGDGHVRGRPTGRHFGVTIYQAKPEMVLKLSELLRSVPHTVGMRKRDPRHLRSYEFRLQAEYARELFKRSELFERGHEGFVLALTPAQRGAYLDAMIDAEGHRQKGKKANHGEFVRIAQVDGDVQNAIRLAVYLHGYRPSFSRLTRNEPQHQPAGSVGLCAPHVSPVGFHPTEQLEKQPVWCVETDLATWTMLQDNQVMLTGNSTFQSNMVPGFTNILDPVSNAASAVNYIGRTYGSPDRIPHLYDNAYQGYARGGVLVGSAVQHLADGAVIARLADGGVVPRSAGSVGATGAKTAIFEAHQAREGGSVAQRDRVARGVVLAGQVPTSGVARERADARAELAIRGADDLGDGRRTVVHGDVGRVALQGLPLLRHAPTLRLAADGVPSTVRVFVEGGLRHGPQGQRVEAPRHTGSAPLGFDLPTPATAGDTAQPMAPYRRWQAARRPAELASGPPVEADVHSPNAMPRRLADGGIFNPRAPLDPRQVIDRRKAPVFILGRPHGLIVAGNVDAASRTRSFAVPWVTVRRATGQASLWGPDATVVLPSWSWWDRDGPRQAVDRYRQSGKHLGIFRTSQDARQYVETLQMPRQPQTTRATPGGRFSAEGGVFRAVAWRGKADEGLGYTTLPTEHLNPDVVRVRRQPGARLPKGFEYGGEWYRGPQLPGWSPRDAGKRRAGEALAAADYDRRAKAAHDHAHYAGWRTPQAEVRAVNAHKAQRAAEKAAYDASRSGDPAAAAAAQKRAMKAKRDAWLASQPDAVHLPTLPKAEERTTVDPPSSPWYGAPGWGVDIGRWAIGMAGGGVLHGRTSERFGGLLGRLRDRVERFTEGGVVDRLRERFVSGGLHERLVARGAEADVRLAVGGVASPATKERRSWGPAVGFESGALSTADRTRGNRERDVEARRLGAVSGDLARRGAPPVREVIHGHTASVERFVQGGLLPRGVLPPAAGESAERPHHRAVGGIAPRPQVEAVGKEMALVPHHAVLSERADGVRERDRFHAGGALAIPAGQNVHDRSVERFVQGGMVSRSSRDTSRDTRRDTTREMQVGRYDPQRASADSSSPLRTRPEGQPRSWAGEEKAGDRPLRISDLATMRLPSFAGGGTVPGAPGTPQVILAHGGERVETAQPIRFGAASNVGGAVQHFEVHVPLTIQGPLAAGVTPADVERTVKDTVGPEVKKAGERFMAGLGSTR